MKAIETNYDGYRFRSRTEARWAVFFDSLEVVYDYEKEGYELPHGRYLPDFFLPYPKELNFGKYPNAGEWIEIKAEEITNEEKQLATDLSIFTKHSTTILRGMPWSVQNYFKAHNSGNTFIHDASEFNFLTKDKQRLAQIWILMSKFQNFSVSSFYNSLDRAKQARF